MLRPCHFQGWSEDIRFCIAEISINLPDKLPEARRFSLLSGIRAELQRCFPHPVFAMRENRIACCLTLTGEESSQPEKRIAVYLAGYDYRAGISYPFDRFADALLYYRQARAAHTYAQEHGTPSAFIACCALDEIVKSSDTSYRRSCIHPAVLRLRSYDLENGTQYAATLREYLRRSGALLEMAGVLGVHRNTVVYRMERLTELFPELDLKDPDEREYLLYSFRLLSVIL